MKGGNVGAGAKGEGKGEGKGSGGPPKRSGVTPVSMPYVMKYLVPEALTSAIIGKGGAVIAQMRTSCNAKIALTDKNEVYPATDCRVLTAQGNDEATLNEVSKQIVQKLNELIKSSGPAEGLGSEGDSKLRVLVPRSAVGGLIGKGGATIKQMRESSGAKISIGEAMGTGPSAEQTVTIGGSEQALRTVLDEVNRQIQMLNSEAWYTAWASSTGVGSGAAYGSFGGMGAMSGMGGNSYSSPGINTMMQVSQGLPPYVMEDSRGFALSCVVPNRLVGGLIGRGGAGTKEVQMITGTKIGIREIPDDPDNRSLNIAGPLANTCAAYMLMMKRYLDSEAQSANAPGASGSGAER